MAVSNDDAALATNRPEPWMRSVMAGDASLAKVFRDFGDRWDIEKIPRRTEWAAVLRDTGSGDYVRLVTAHDLHALRYRMNEVERDEPEEREPGDQRQNG